METSPTTVTGRVAAGSELEIPAALVPARQTPLFDLDSRPAPLAQPHRTTVWARFHVEHGTVTSATCRATTHGTSASNRATLS